MTVAGQVDLRSLTDDQLRTLVDTIRDALPNELTEPLKVLAEVSRRLTELQHRREAEAVAPEGWKLVPREPTPEMLQAGVEVTLRDQVVSREKKVAEVYRAMLAASPSSPASGVRVIDDRERKNGLTINLSDREIAVLDELVQQHELTRNKVMVQALRSYQLFVAGELVPKPDTDFAPPALSALGEHP